MKKYLVFIPLLIALVIGLWLSAPYLNREKLIYVFEPDSLQIEKVDEPVFLFGYRLDSIHVLEDFIKSNQSLSDILLPKNISHQTLFQLASNTRNVFDVRKIRAGRPYTILMSLDSAVRELIYEPNNYEYIVFHLSDTVYAERFEREIKVRSKQLSGVIDVSLAVTIETLGESVELTNRFVDVFAWQIDFFRLQKGDYFKIIFTENLVEDVPIGLEQIQAIYFNHEGNDYWAFAYDQGNGLDYFDENGNSLRKALLKYPLEFSRISSRYSMSRFHPVQKRYKSHLGTDFAAQPGTPIRSVGDGIITEAMYKSNNGNYVKIRHNATYSTQYLHMSRIAPGIRPGERVRQGQLIGFVGSTGLATGPHLCYRFWKNGVQVDALKVDLPPSEPIVEESMEDFIEVKNSFELLLEKIS